MQCTVQPCQLNFVDHQKNQTQNNPIKFTKCTSKLTRNIFLLTTTIATLVSSCCALVALRDKILMKFFCHINHEKNLVVNCPFKGVPLEDGKYRYDSTFLNGLSPNYKFEKCTFDNVTVNDRLFRGAIISHSKIRNSLIQNSKIRFSQIISSKIFNSKISNYSIIQNSLLTNKSTVSDSKIINNSKVFRIEIYKSIFKNSISFDSTFKNKCEIKNKSRIFQSKAFDSLVEDSEIGQNSVFDHTSIIL